MSYDEAVEAAAEAIGDVLGFEYSSLYNKPMARAAIAAALPHLKVGYDREAIAQAIYRRHTGDSDPDAEPWLMHEDLADAVIKALPPLPTDADLRRTEAEIKAEALEEAADSVRRSDWYTSWKVDNYAGTIRRWLCVRAARLRDGKL